MAKGRSGGRRGGGEGLNPSDILGTNNLILDTALDELTRKEIHGVLKDFKDEYGLEYNNTRIANIKSKANVLAYYDGAGIAINKKYLDSKKMDDVYKECVKTGFHPSSGNKTGMEAVVAHELGHSLNDMIGAKMGGIGIDKSADAIVKEARKNTRHRGVVQMASKISGYATHSNAEAVAEAVADVYCNGNKAKAESRAIYNVMQKYLKN